MLFEEHLNKWIEAYMKENNAILSSSGAIVDEITDRQEKMKALLLVHIIDMLNRMLEKQEEIVERLRK